MPFLPFLLKRRKSAPTSTSPVRFGLRESAASFSRDIQVPAARAYLRYGTLGCFWATLRDPRVVIAVTGKGSFGDTYREFSRTVLCSSDTVFHGDGKKYNKEG